jgi:hypothetical protein
LPLFTGVRGRSQGVEKVVVGRVGGQNEAWNNAKTPQNGVFSAWTRNWKRAGWARILLLAVLILPEPLNMIVDRNESINLVELAAQKSARKESGWGARRRSRRRALICD